MILLKFINIQGRDVYVIALATKGSGAFQIVAVKIFFPTVTMISLYNDLIFNNKRTSFSPYLNN